MIMINKEEYAILMQYGDELAAHRAGRCVTVTRTMWSDIAPILKKHLGWGGALVCRHCCLELMSHACGLCSEYEKWYEARYKKGKEDGKEKEA